MNSYVDTSSLGDRRKLLDKVGVMLPELILSVLAPVHESLVGELGKSQQDEGYHLINFGTTEEVLRTNHLTSLPSQWPTAVSGSNFRATRPPA